MPLEVEIWSDVVCPWCHIGKRRFEAALARFAHASEVEVVWRAFELDRTAPRSHDDGTTYAARLARKYRTGQAQAQEMIDRMTQTAAAEGVKFDFDIARPGNTFDAHRLLHHARASGLQNALKERLLCACFGEGEPIGERDTLLRLAVEVGLEAEGAREVLFTDTYADEVRADEARAGEIGISGVPFFVIGGRYAVEGAQSADTMLGALNKAWSERPALVTISGPVCGPDGC